MSLLILGVGVTGCSQGSGDRITNSTVLDRKVLGLQQGMSIDAVKAELGEPVTEFIAEGEKVSALYYRAWQLLFNRRGLERRLREHWPERRVVTPLNKELDGKVLKLRRGMSISAVKAKLGTPESYYDVFRSSPIPEKILRYGPWEISFTPSGKLRMRTEF